MRPKILIWTGVGIIAVTIGILITWAALAGLLPRIEFQARGPVIVIPPNLDAKALNLLDLFAQTAVVPLKIFAGFLQISLQQAAEVFRIP